jgi:hypothetical protein
LGSSLAEALLVRVLPGMSLQVFFSALLSSVQRG